MQQLRLLNDTKQIINVASVPHRSPFRYPGGKTWLVPHVRQWISRMASRPTTFIEPFAGGGIVGLSAIFENLTDHLIAIELDEQVAAVWQTMLNGNAEWLANAIVAFDVTEETVTRLLSGHPDTLRDMALRTLVKNRVNRGGILAPGAGRVKQGENGKGLKSRWYPETLKRRILDIAMLRERITFIACDGMAFLEASQDRRNAIYFIDPPYTAVGKKAGSRLYRHSDLDHERLFSLTSKLSGDFLMTYDATPEIANLARCYGFDVEYVAMKNTHHAEMNELLIGRNLDWIR